MTWMIDGSIDLTLEYNRANGHRLSIIDNLCAAGLSRGDAEAYAEFIIADNSKIRDYTPEECVTDEQWERLEVVYGE